MPARRLLLLIVLALMVGAACWPWHTTTKSSKVVIRYWEKWSGFEADAMRAVVDDFNRSQDRILVEYTSVGDIDHKLMLSTAGGIPPDVAGLWSQTLASYVENNALTPLDRMAAQAGIGEIGRAHV